MRDPENLEEVCGLSPDFVGYIFYGGSKRYVGKQPDPAIFRIPGGRAKRVGVFVNETLPELKRIVERSCLDMVQLHGGESPEYCRELTEAGIEVIKVLDPFTRSGGTDPSAYPEGIKYFLFDTPGKGFGGTGRKFNWDLLDGFVLPAPFLLSGGIGPGDAPVIKGMKHPMLSGVDVNSRFEISPGLKDVGLLASFINEIRK